MSSHDVTIAGYLLVAAAALALELAAYGHRVDVQSLGTVLSRVMRTRAGRIGLVAAWAWLGMHFFAR
jgi:Family of unknown function (DUF6186)